MCRSVKIVSTATLQTLHTVLRPKTFYIRFSPNGNYLVTWESFYTCKEQPDGAPNLHVYSTATGQEVFATVQKKNSGWEPSWSSDESIFALMLGGEAFFYETKAESAFNRFTRKIGGARNGALSVAPNANQPFVAFYTPGQKGAPSMCKIFKYPDLQAAQPIGCKSFFQADSVDLLWNKRGSGLLLLTSTEVDPSGASYYGKQALHFMTTKGDSFAVQLSEYCWTFMNMNKLKNDILCPQAKRVPCMPSRGIPTRPSSASSSARCRPRPPSSISSAMPPSS